MPVIFLLISFNSYILHSMFSLWATSILYNSFRSGTWVSCMQDLVPWLATMVLCLHCVHKGKTCKPPHYLHVSVLLLHSRIPNSKLFTISLVLNTFTLWTIYTRVIEVDIPNLLDIVCVGVIVLIHDERLPLHTCFYATGGVWERD